MRDSREFERTINFDHRSLVKANRHNLLKGAISLVIVDSIVFSLPLLIKLAIDHLQGLLPPTWVPSYFAKLEGFSFVLTVGMLYLALAAFIAYGRYWWRVHLMWSTFPLFHSVRNKFFRHLQSLGRDFFRTNKIGDLISALTTDTENMRMTLAIGSLMVIDAGINFAIFPFVLWALSPELTLWIVPPLLVLSLAMVLITKRLSGMYQRVQEITGDLSGRAFEMMAGIRIIKAFRKEAEVHADFTRSSEELRDASMEVAKFQSLFVPVLDLALSIAVIVALLWGGTKVIRGEMTLATLIAYRLYLGNLDWPMMAVGWFVQMYRMSHASKKRIQKFSTQKNPLHATTEEPVAELHLNAPFAFEIRNVDFAYPNRGDRVFQNLNLKIPANQWTAVTGPVGSGKTCLLELLSRQIDPLSGEIRFFEAPLRALAPEKVSESILYVPQESFMFSKSIRSNLNLGLSVPAKDEAIWSLLEDLSFDPQLLQERGGLETRLGERGVNLSGGQKQRLSLGRALVRRRLVYLFDDLFSHVDAETELKLISTLRKRLQGVTVLLASQRLETLRECDNMIVLKEGGLDYFGKTSEANSSFLSALESLQTRELSERRA